MRAGIIGEQQNMAQLAYNIRSAALEAAVSEHAIKIAVREGNLLTSERSGNRVILHDDLHAWISGGRA